MTTMALTEPPLKRLFERLDFAPQPTTPELAAVLARWEAARAGAVAPRRQAIAFSEQDRGALDALFVHRFEDDDAVLTEGETAAKTLLGACRVGDRLSQAANRRGAVRLRRLFKEVRRSGQPVLAQYTSIEHGRDLAVVELLATPLSEDGRTIELGARRDLRSHSRRGGSRLGFARSRGSQARAFRARRKQANGRTDRAITGRRTRATRRS